MGAAAVLSCVRYSALDEAEKEAYKKSQIEKGVWNEELAEMQAAMNGADYKKMSITWITFDLGEYFGALFTESLGGKPWATIMEELYPLVDSKIKRVYSTTG